MDTGVGNEPTESVDSVFTDGDYITIDYASVRARTDDPLQSVANPFPDDYRVVTRGSTVSDNRQGFRIQILSTQNRDDAEIMLENYKIWLASQQLDINPKGYIQFRAPFFRVHVGDFYDRNLALDLVTRMKGQFPDAWVVADTVDPTEAAKY
jgi:hypothetical protein